MPWCRSPAPRWRGAPPLDPIDFVRTIAVARITMPRSMVRLSAGRESMSAETQALCFLAGANSIFYGEKLLTTAQSRRRGGQGPVRPAGPYPDGDSMPAPMPATD